MRPDGKFTLSLTPGDYSLRVFGQNVGNEAMFTDISVTGSDIDGIQITAVKPSTIRGRIAFTDREPWPTCPGTSWKVRF